MSTLNNSLALYDSAPTALYDRAAASVNVLAQMAVKATVNLSQTNISIVSINQSLEKTGEKSSTVFGAMGKMLKKTEESFKAFNVMGKVWGKMKEGMKIADDYSRLETRLKAVNGEIKNQGNLQDKVFAAANRSKASYSDMVGTVADLQGLTGDSFSTDEALGMSELLHKSYKLGGTDDKTQSSGVNQIVKSMGKGKIGSDVFDNITQNAPAMLAAMEAFTGKSEADLRKMAEQGTLTADILKNSMFAAASTINDKFSNMPMTFDDIGKRIKNALFQAFGGAIDGVIKIINSGGFQKFISMVIVGIYTAGSILDWVIGILDFIAPILETIGGVLLAVMIPNLWKAASAIWASVPAAWAAVSAFIVANWTLILVVATIVLIVNALSILGVTAQDVFNFIGGVVGVFIAFFYNRFVLIWNYVAAFINFFGNVFTHPIASIKALFFDLTSTIIGYIKTMAQGIEDLINNIPGVEVNITGRLDGLERKLKKASATAKDEAGLIEFTKSKDFIDYSEFATKGSQIGSDIYKGVSDKISDFTNGFGLGKDETDLFGYGGSDASNLPGLPGNNDLGTPSNPVSVQGTGSNGNLAVDMAEEDIQYLRDIAERDYINKFSTATVAPNIQVSFGDIHQEADADKVAGRIQRILREQIATAGEGVY